jgi:hypothetical protein
MRVWPYLQQKLEALKRLRCMFRTITEEDRKSWRVVKLSKSDEVSVSEDRGFEEIDCRSRGAQSLRQLPKQ